MRRRERLLVWLLSGCGVLVYAIAQDRVVLLVSTSKLI